MGPTSVPVPTAGSGGGNVSGNQGGNGTTDEFVQASGAKRKFGLRWGEYIFGLVAVGMWFVRH